jgi:hypothetical protein
MTLDERNDEVNKALEARFSQLNAALEAHEAKLKAMMVPSDTWVTYRSYDDGDNYNNPTGEYQFYIGMVKLRGAWRLCLRKAYECWIDDERSSYGEIRPVVEASVEERIEVAQHIDKLREAIVQTKEKLVPDVEKAIATLAKSLEVYGADRK